MTAPVDSPLPLPSLAVSPTLAAGAPRRSLVDRFLQWAGDRLNPILVKETRQALKSKQFLITFILLLLCAWLWTILGVAWIGPGVYYGANGREMFSGYCLILAFSLLVIVPFGAFRSLAGEQEDRTYELLSITTLSPRQIVGGKLGSAIVQMLVYLSAISPCLAFTYILRGIDFPTIMFVLLYTVLGSLALSVTGLLLGTLTSQKHWQVILSVALVIGLLLAFIMCVYAVLGVVYGLGGVLLGSPGFWQGNAGFLSGYLSYFLLVFYAAAAQLTFASDNRSTRLRVTMLAQQLLLVGWIAWAWLRWGEHDVLFVFLSCSALHWFVMGALMIGESPELSLRVKRRLPQSFLGRMFLTWFNPGPGTGYVFAVAGMFSAGIMAAAAAALGEIWPGLIPSSGSPPYDSSVVFAFAALAVSYLTIYLGIGLLLMRFLLRVTRVSVQLSLLVEILLVLVGIFVPLVAQWMTLQWRNASYSLLHVSNPFWSCVEVSDSRTFSAGASTAELLTLVPLVALLVFALNLRGIAGEVRHVRIARPRRVAEEDAQLRALKSPPQPVRISPWDEIPPEGLEMK